MQFTILIPCFETKVGEPNICLVFLILCASETQVNPENLLKRDQRMFQNMSGLKTCQEVSCKRIKLSPFYFHGFYFVTKGSYLILIDYLLGLETEFLVLTT